MEDLRGNEVIDRLKKKNYAGDAARAIRILILGFKMFSTMTVSIEPLE